MKDTALHGACQGVGLKTTPQPTPPHALEPPEKVVPYRLPAVSRSLFDRRHCIGVIYIDINRIDDIYFWKIQGFL